MCRMWDGPKLVTTPGSDFAALCSLLFEAVSGRSDEGLAGAINRYARSEDRKQWDREGEDEDERDNDNFLSEKNTMRSSEQEVELVRLCSRTAACQIWQESYCSRGSNTSNEDTRWLRPHTARAKFTSAK
jgi:hypothetical protein